MRAAVVDIGTNSTRLLIADVGTDGGITESVRRSVVTRLGAGVDAEGSLAQDACERVLSALREFGAEIDAHKPGNGARYPNLAVMTSAVRDARNGRGFAERIRRECDLDARILTGEEEARMTFLGAMSGRPSAIQPTVVIDIGGGSTEFIVGVGRTAGFHVSLPAGVVRMSERHIHSDPPATAELQALAADTRAVYLAGLPAPERAPVRRGIAVAGTATSAAAIDQELDPYDPERVHGYPLLLATVEMLLARLADMDEAQRRAVVGLDPGRAPTIVAGMILLSEALRAFDLDEVEVSEHDILHGGALSLASSSGPHGSSDI
ncbi:MAG TPA: Ppx/GppA phosphatase family protein [Solirubrobacteraceae bacterium]|jgi:exopolyphosphatase/guanosine-5'-triphosphate,3'-diphosphate pyrophosphatase|nr:Ppx/GppA phosphatase family protein [Solirubrobacteraceae bacterium]